MKHVLFGLFSVLLIGLPSVVHTAFASTNVSGVVSENTTWTAAASPYILTDKVTIASGTILTLEKGTIVKLGESGIEIYGAMHAEGTETEPVFITSIKDDSVGGDTNGDGSNTSPALGDWQGLLFNAGASGTFDHTVIRYAGYGYYKYVPQISAIHNRGATVVIRDSELAYSQTCAVGQSAGSLVVERSNAHDLTCGIVALGGSIQLHNNQIKNTGIGLFINGANTIELVDNTFESNQITADINLSPVLSFMHERNTAMGGQFNGIILRGVLSHNLHLTKDTMPYIISGGGWSGGYGGLSLLTDSDFIVGGGSALTVDPGVVVKFHDSAQLIVNGKLSALGELDKPISFTSIKDDSVGGDTNGDGTATAPASGDWVHVQFNAGGEGSFENASIKYGGWNTSLSGLGSGANVYNKGGVVTVRDSELAFGKSTGILHSTGTTTVNQSFIHDNPNYGVSNSSSKILDATNNYWGDPSGPYHSIQNPTGQGGTVSDNVLFNPWKGTHCTQNCFSSVLFLPGIEASRLYKKDFLGFEDQLWEPDGGNQDVQQLGMNPNGVSNNTIYTRGIIPKALGVVDVYEGFSRFMTNLVHDGVIAGWTPFAYDWRYSVADIAQNGALYEDGVRSAITELEYLASHSKTGKVTIIGHSNGGLLAKAIMQRLVRDGKVALVDKVVFLATPQLGTPKAIATILHGYDQEQLGGLVTDDGVARDAIRNMPGAYGLVPTQKYFNTAPGLVVFFDTSASTQAFRTAYGNAIHSEADLQNFMSGQLDGRIEATTINQASKANSVMLTQALTDHKTLLDNWIAPAGVKVVEVVGVGLDTMSGIEYRGFTERICGNPDLFGQRQCKVKEIYKPVPIISQYGDKTVMGQSAEGYGGVKEKYYLNLDGLKQQNTPIEHSDFTEAVSVQTLVKNILQNTQTSNLDFISPTATNIDLNRVMFGAHSPVTLQVTDKQGRRVKLDTSGSKPVILVEIPGSSYFELGGSKYIIVPDGVQYDVQLTGTDQGGLTFSLDTLRGETQTKTLEVKVATITASTTIHVPYTATTIGNLLIDTNNDGQTDIILSPAGVDITPVVPKITYATLKSAIESLSLSQIRKAPLLLLTATADALDKKSVTNPKLAPLELLALNQLEALVVAYQKKGWITQIESQKIITIINKLK